MMSNWYCNGSDRCLAPTQATFKINGAIHVLHENYPALHVSKYSPPATVTPAYSNPRTLTGQ